MATAEEIQADILKKLKNAISEAAYDIAFEIEGHYEMYIDKFYEFQTKGTYSRGYNLYLGSDVQGNPSSGITFFDNGFQAGIHVSSANLGEPYKDPASYVFTGAYEMGIHGTTNTGGQGVAPMSLMNSWFDSFKKTGIKPIVDKYMKTLSSRR